MTDLSTPDKRFLDVASDMRRRAQECQTEREKTEKLPANIAAADAFFGVFGFKRVGAE